jgi:YidC/Oxa1 family membrane protein insertase
VKHKTSRKIVLVMVLLLATALLAGCAPTTGQIDLHKPNGIWEAIVYGVALALQALNGAIQSTGIPYSWGWAIIIFTIAIKIVTLPLTLKQLQSTKATQELQPRLAELQQKYGKDRQKLSEEQMKLYKEAGVNPLGGCLPLLIQMPVLFALYQAMYALANPSVGSLEGARFLWIPNLAFPDLKTGMSWLAADFAKQNWGILVAYISLPVIMILTQLILQKMSTPLPAATKSPQDDQQRMMGQMMLFMPIFFGYITLGLPSGLTLYWTVSNLLSIVQQYFITGWGSLVTWFPMLKPSTGQVAVVRTTEAAPAASTPAGGEDRPIKRRRRRK